MNFWNTYVNQESEGCITQPRTSNKAPVMHQALLMSMIKQSIRHSLAVLKELSVP